MEKKTEIIENKVYGTGHHMGTTRMGNDKSISVVDRNLKIYHSISRSFLNFDNKRVYFEYKYRLVLIKKIGTLLDKIFGYSTSAIKLIMYVVLVFNERHRYKIFPVFLALMHFYQNKLGDFDRKNKIF